MEDHFYKFEEKKKLYLSIFFLAFIFCFITSLNVGAFNISLWELIEQYFQYSKNSVAGLKSIDVFLLIRLPRVTLCAFCGASIAVAGSLIQGLLRNPLASPSLLGTSSGASLAVIAVFFYFGTFIHPLWITLSSFLGAFLSTVVILCLWKNHNSLFSSQILTYGLVWSMFLTGIASLFISLSLADHEKSSAMIHWVYGAWKVTTWPVLTWGICFMSLGLILAFYNAKPLNVLALGEETAQTLGLNIYQIKTRTVLICSFLVGTSVSFGGLLPFVGLIIPHFTRWFLGYEHRRLIIASSFNGATFTILADLIARAAFLPKEVDLGVILALLGIPFFLTLIWKPQNGIT